jgi:hypothetical protein
VFTTEQKREHRKAARNVGEFPKVSRVWRGRRKRCATSLCDFCRTFLDPKFYLPFSPDHLRIISRLEEIVLHGGLLAVAMPRGSGKTELVKAAALWAMLYGYRKFVVVVGATSGDAVRIMADLKATLAHSDEIHAAFPEATHCVRDVAGAAIRARYQSIDGEPSGIEWTRDYVRLAWVKKAACSGAVVRTAGITGAIRGMSVTGPDGMTIRPDLVLLDDPQDREALDVDTPIPTPSGFVRMGDLREGDTVFDEHGRPCNVTAVSETYTERPCYRVTFDDGSAVVTDAGHLWATSTALQRTNRRRKLAVVGGVNPRPQCRPKPYTSVVTTARIAETLTGEGGRRNHSIPLTGVLNTPDAELPIPPYTLGVWLGDGTTASNRITSADAEVLTHIRGDGFTTGSPYWARRPDGELSKAATYTIHGLRPLLRAAGLLGNKHLPVAYLFASREQRLSVLQGLMDSDGWVRVGRRGTHGTRCGFHNTNRKIIDAVLFLCRSLGIKPTCGVVGNRTKPRASPGWTVTFVTSESVFRLRRKLERLPPVTKPSTRRRFIESVEPVPTRPVRCIAVDSPNRLYLCGEALIPTHNSATSPTQTDDRERIIRGDILGLAGPKKTISVAMTVTVICENDLADKFLDREANPQWNGERTRLVESFPTNEALWEEYFRVRDESLRSGGDRRAATAFYLANRDAMSAGGAVSWPDRYDDVRYASALEEAMVRRHDDPEAFAAECQNDPVRVGADRGEVRELHAAELAKRVCNLPRGVLPREATRLAAFIDVGGRVLWYGVCAFSEKFDGWLVDYGAYPRQSRSYFAAGDAHPNLPSEMPGLSEPQLVYAGLKLLTGEVLGREYPRDGGGAGLSVQACAVDCGWLPDQVHQFVRESSHKAVLIPSKGYATSSNAKSMDEWQRKEGERAGPSWRLGPPPSGRGRQLIFDPDYWKSFLADRLTTPPGGGGALQFFGDRPAEHRLLADHLTAEYATRVTVRNRTFDKWELRPGGAENHLFDVLTGCCVAASTLGLTWNPGGPPKPAEPRQRVKLSELFAQKNGGKR